VRQAQRKKLKKYRKYTKEKMGNHRDVGLGIAAQRNILENFKQF